MELAAGKSELATLELGAALLEGDMERALGALERGADPNVRNSLLGGRAPLHWAAGAPTGAEPGLLGLLMEFGADAQATDALGREPIHVAGLGARLDNFRLLAERCDVEATWGSGQTALNTGAMAGAGAEVLALLVERGADPRAADRSGVTPLMAALYSGSLEAAAWLIPRSDLGAVDDEGRDALLWAVEGAGSERLRAALPVGNPRRADKGGNTALHLAARGGERAKAELLIPGSDLGARDKWGRTPRGVAAAGGHWEVEGLLAAAELARAEAEALAEAAAGGGERGAGSGERGEPGRGRSAVRGLGGAGAGLANSTPSPMLGR